MIGKQVREVMYDLYNTNWVGEETGTRGVGFLYICENGVKKNYYEKLKRLRDDYPESEGYVLIKRYDKAL